MLMKRNKKIKITKSKKKKYFNHTTRIDTL